MAILSIDEVQNYVKLIDQALKKIREDKAIKEKSELVSQLKID